MFSCARKRIREYIRAYWRELGTLDGVAFTAAVGQNSPELREAVLHGLEKWGITLDPVANEADRKDARCITTEQSTVPVWVIPTNEEFAIAKKPMILSLSYISS